MLARLDHVIVAVGELETAMCGFARLLGRSHSWRGENPSAGTADARFRLENTTLELLAPSGAGPVGAALRRWLEARGEGPLGLAFATDSAERCRAALAARGLEPGPVENGLGRDVESGALREWRRVSLPLARTRGVPLLAVEPLSPADLQPRIPALGDEAAAVQALDHAVIRTGDPDAARGLYAEALGLSLALDREFPQWGLRLVFLRVGGVTIELAAELGAPFARRADDRLFGLSWRVRDAGAARERLASAGFEVSELRPGRLPGTKVFDIRGGVHGVPTLLFEPAPRGGGATPAGAA